MIDERKRKALDALKNPDWGRTVEAPLHLEFTLLSLDKEQELVSFEKEYATLSNINADPLGEFMKYARAKGDSESDEVMLKLLVALHHKIDELKKIITNDVQEFIKLEHKEDIKALGHGVIFMPKPVFQANGEYYARIDLPVFPQRIIPLFFEAVEPTIARVKRIHERDERDWDGYIASQERALIRELKGL